MADTKIAKKFLNLFNHKKYTLLYLSNIGVRSFPCAPQNLDKALDLLAIKNKNNDIYFMVNEGSGELNEAKTACHSTKNVIALTSIFLDLEVIDGSDPLPSLKTFCNQYFCEPTCVIETSPFRYHVYWILTDATLDKKSVTRWKQVQALLHSKLSSDRTMTDLPQVLRIPGFKNLKKDYPVNILDLNPELHYYLDKLYYHLEKNFPEIREFKAFEPLKPLEENYTVKEGERHEEILRRARKIYNLEGISDQDVKCFVDGFIYNHVKNPHEFVNGGKRRNEIDRILQAAKSYSEEEKRKEAEIKVTKAIEKVDKKKSPFELDPEFYYQAPGLVGEITRHFVDTSDSPIPSHAFAAAASIVGFTKARYIQGIKQLPPTNYFLCLAPSGSGKTTIQHMVKTVMKDLQISHLIEDGIASAQGLIQFLYNVDGLGMVIYDEVRSLFQIMQSRHAASFETMIPVELTKLYTAYKSIYIPPTTKTYKGKKVTIEKPKLSFMGYGQHTLVNEKLFTLQNIQAGLLPRFIILAVNESKDVNAIEKKLPSHILDQLRSHTLKSAFSLEEKVKNLPSPPLDTSPKIQTVLLDSEAQAKWDAFRALTIKLKNEEIAQETGLEAMYSRGAEQALRLSLCLTNTDIIELKEMEFSVSLINAQMQNFRSLFSKAVDQTEFSKLTDRLYNKMLDMMKVNNAPILKRDLQRATQSWFKPNEFKTVYQSIQDQGRISEFTKDKKILIQLDDIEN